MLKYLKICRTFHNWTPRLKLDSRCHDTFPELLDNCCRDIRNIISRSRGRRKRCNNGRERGRGGQLCVDSRGKKRGGWFIALADLHSASRSRRTNLGSVPILNLSTRASYVSSTQKSRTRERGSGVFSNLREHASMHANQSLIVWFAGQCAFIFDKK